MRRLFLVLAMALTLVNVKAEEKNGFGATLRESNFHLNVDLQTKYLWRGMEMMTEDSAPVIFPSIAYTTGGFYAYVMGGYSINGKYSEVDLGASYTAGWFTFGLNGYYYPTNSTPNDNYFDFKSKTTGHWWEAVVTMTPTNIPGYIMVSNFFAGADRNLDGKQAYSTYAEIGTHYDFLKDNT